MTSAPERSSAPGGGPEGAARPAPSRPPVGGFTVGRRWYDVAWRVGRVGGTDVEIAASWLLIAALIAVAVAPYARSVRPGLGAGAYAVGVLVAVMLYLAVLVHEASHVVLARRHGHAVPTITLSFMGGRTAVEGEARTALEEAVTAGVGPLTSLAVGGVFLAGGVVLPDPDRSLGALVVAAVAWSNLGLGLLNLVPVLPLDGGRVLKALVWGMTGSPHRGTLAAGWAARVGAVVVLLYAVGSGAVWGTDLPVVDLGVALAVAGFLWAAAQTELRIARLRLRFAGLVVAQVIRPVVLVPADLPVAAAIETARRAGARGLVTLDRAGVPRGVVPDAFAPELLGAADVGGAGSGALPVGIGFAARPFQRHRPLSAGITGDELLLAINAEPVADYLVLEGGRIVGVLLLSDVDRAIAPG